MGSSASSLTTDTPGADLRLPVSGLKFTSNQLRALNSYVDTLNEEDQKGRISTELESEVESLVQRIVDGAGQRDPRFRCCHIIALHRGKKMRSRSLEYLVSLDSLRLNAGEDCLQDGPVGYGKVRLAREDKWGEFLTPAGYLCRDKVVERWVELIARCAAARGGGAARVLCARAAERAKPYQYCYLERAQSHQTTNDKRLAIVEGAAWVMVRVGAGEAEAKLMLGVRVEGCNAAAYTTRVPMTHPLALLHYTSGQEAYYAVAVGPPTSIICNERASTWQLWHPSLEAGLDAHCSELSSLARIAGALNTLVDRMRDGSYQGTLRVLSRYAVSCALRRRVDAIATHAQPSVRGCVAAHAAHHLLMVLDSVLYLCERGGVAGYVYPVDRGCLVRRASRASDWSCDAACVRNCLMQLQQIAGEDIPPTPAESLETALFSKWEHLNKEARSSVTLPKYTRRQLRYLSRTAAELVRCKSMVVFENHSIFRANLLQATSQHQESVEELIHVLAIMLDQARDACLNQARSGELSTYRSKKWNKLKEYYDASSACLIDTVRRDPDLRNEDLSDGLVLMKQVLSWLHRGAKDDKKYLGPVLKPYLDALFNVSLENSLFLDDFYGSRGENEFEGLKEYCTDVHDGKLEPCTGLLEAAKKQAWAKTVVDFVDRFRHIEFRLVFPTGDGMAVSFPVKLPRRDHASARLLTLSRRDKAEAKLRLARRCVLGAFATALVGERSVRPKPIPRHGSSDEILTSVKSGQYWRNSTKPDIISSTSSSLDLPKLRKSRRRPMTSYGFPEISITNQSDTKTLRRKYHTLKSLVYTEPVENVREMRRRPRSAGNSLRNKEAMSRPTILETLDFINTVKDSLNVEESGLSDAEDTWTLEDEWVVGQMAPLNLLAAKGTHSMHLALGELVPALLRSGRFTILQELCSFLGDASDGALFALHRLARASRSRSSERSTGSWRLPEAQEESPQKYRPRPPDYVSGDEAPQPPPLPRRNKQVTNTFPDYLPPKRLQDLETHLSHLELINSQLNLAQKPLPDSYTGIINPIYDIKIPKDKFNVKRSKSLGRSFSTKKLGLEITKYNLTLGRRGKRTNDVITAMNGVTGETGLGHKGSYFQRNSGNCVGDTYRVSRVTID